MYTYLALMLAYLQARAQYEAHLVGDVPALQYTHCILRHAETIPVELWACKCLHVHRALLSVQEANDDGTGDLKVFNPMMYLDMSPRDMISPRAIVS